MAQITTTTSKKFSLNLSDLTRGLIVAIITPVITVIISSLNAGSLTFDWKAIAITALTAGLAYVVKNFLTPSLIVMHNAPEEVVQAVKDGDKELKVVQS